MSEDYRILVINPGTTSTKIQMIFNKRLIFGNKSSLTLKNYLIIIKLSTNIISDKTLL